MEFIHYTDNHFHKLSERKKCRLCFEKVQEQLLFLTEIRINRAYFRA